MILGAHVAADVDTLDINARTLVDHVGDVDATRFRITISARANTSEGIPLLRDNQRQLFNRLVDVGRVEDLARLRQHFAVQAVRNQSRQSAFDAHITEVIKLALFDHERDVEA